MKTFLNIDEKDYLRWKAGNVNGDDEQSIVVVQKAIPNEMKRKVI